MLKTLGSRLRSMRARTAALLLMAAMPLGFLGVHTAMSCACDQCECGGQCDCGI